MEFDRAPDVSALWKDGYALIIENQPDVALPLLGAAAYSRFRPPFPGVAYITGAPAAGKSTIGHQIADFLEPDGSHGNLAEIDGPDLPREPIFVDNASRRRNPSAKMHRRLSKIVDDHLDDPGRRILILAGDPVSHRELDDQLWRLTINHPIPLAVVRESSRPWGMGARRRLGSAFADWVAQQDQNVLYDEYLSTWPDERDTHSSNPAAELASAFGLDLLRRFLTANGSTIVVPNHHRASSQSHDIELSRLPAAIMELRSKLLEAIHGKTVQLEGLNYDPAMPAPLVGRVDGDRILLIPKLTVPLLFPKETSTASLRAELGAELDGCGLLQRTADNTTTTVARVNGRSTRVWVISSSLFQGTELASGASQGHMDGAQ